jgi:hypothetical protein
LETESGKRLASRRKMPHGSWTDIGHLPTRNSATRLSDIFLVRLAAGVVRRSRFRSAQDTLRAGPPLTVAQWKEYCRANPPGRYLPDFSAIMACSVSVRAQSYRCYGVEQRPWTWNGGGGEATGPPVGMSNCKLGLGPTGELCLSLVYFLG